MLRKRLRWLPGLFIVAVGLTAVGYSFRQTWLPLLSRSEAPKTEPPAEETTGPTDKIIVGDQAQKNLNLSAKPLKAVTFWKTITIPGTVVDRPGVSDREIVAPAIGVVSKTHHVPGDTVRPGDVMFTLGLTSDALHQSQTDLLKTSEEIKLAQDRLKRLVAAGEGISKAKLREVESEIKRLEVSLKAQREHLLRRGLSASDLDRVIKGDLVTEIPVVVPKHLVGTQELATEGNGDPESASADPSPLTFEVQNLQVEVGQQVEAGQTLCLLSNHRSLGIEGRAFRDETPLLERSVKEGWPVEVDFQASDGDWPAAEQEFRIQHVGNTIDPATRTFAVRLPLENQWKTIQTERGVQRLWRYRPGQKVWLRARIEKLDNVFVLPVEAVVREGAEAYVFTQNVNTFERKSVHLVLQDRQRAVIANDSSLPTYRKKDDVLTLSAIVQTAAAQLNRMTKAGTSGVPKGYHIHADGSLHKNEDEAK